MVQLSTGDQIELLLIAVIDKLDSRDGVGLRIMHGENGCHRLDLMLSDYPGIDFEGLAIGNGRIGNRLFVCKLIYHTERGQSHISERCDQMATQYSSLSIVCVELVDNQLLVLASGHDILRGVRVIAHCEDLSLLTSQRHNLLESFQMSLMKDR